MHYSIFCPCYIYIFIVDLPASTSQLATRALDKLSQAFRPSTSRTYNRMFRDFLGFLVVAGISLQRVTHQLLLAFMQYLLDNQLTYSNVTNYWNGIRAFFVVHGCNTTAFQHEQIQLFQKSIKLNGQFKPKSNTVMTIEHLQNIIILCDTLPHPVVFKAVYLVAFFSFLRVSNFLHSTKSFDPTGQLAIGDLFFCQDGVTILIKWSKTIQNRCDTNTISLPSLGSSIIVQWLH